MTQRELQYLWVWVSLSATESVQEVLLEGHPSWKYLEEVHTLLLDVRQGLAVNSVEVQAGRAGVCVCGPWLWREDINAWSSRMSWRMWKKWVGRVVGWAWGARDVPETLFLGSVIPGQVTDPSLFVSASKK